MSVMHVPMLVITTLPFIMSYMGYPNSIYMTPLALSHGISQKLEVALSLGYHQVWVTLSLECASKSWDAVMHGLFQFLSLHIRDEAYGINFPRKHLPLICKSFHFHLTSLYLTHKAKS
ncbi:hypothetical protein AAZX31_19G096000 [Glycine max]